MSSLSSTELGGGNVNPSPKLDHCQGWKWKVNYHLQDDESFESVFNDIENIIVPICDLYTFGEEYGDQGITRHIEGAFLLKGKSRMRRTKLLNMFKWNYCQIMKGKWEDQKYNIKEGNKILTNYKFKVKKPLKKLACEIHGLKPWMNILLEELKKEPDDRCIYWFKGSVGVGKTNFCKYINRNLDWVCITGGSHKDMKNSIVEYLEKNDYCPEICILNVPKAKDKEFISYIGIEEVKDMFFYSGKYHGDMVDGNNPHMVIFSNEYPDWDVIDPKRWKCYDISRSKWTNEADVLSDPYSSEDYESS